MKKIIASLAIFAFVAGALALRPAAASERERILSPEQIKHYRDIIKEGAVLFGVKIEDDGRIEVKDETKDEQESNDDGDEGQVATSSVKNLEKIPAPSMISTFEKIQKIGNALWGIKKSDDNKRPASGTDVSSGQLEKILTPSMISSFEKIRKVGTALWGVKKGEDRKSEDKSGRLTVSAEMSACVAAAIDVKDKALIARANAAATELVAAISDRSACQQAAVQSTSGQKDNLGLCVKAFEAGVKQLREASKTAHRAAWNTYQTSLKTCRTTVMTTTTAEIVIEDGSSEGSLEAIVE